MPNKSMFSLEEETIKLSRDVMHQAPCGMTPQPSSEERRPQPQITRQYLSVVLLCPHFLHLVMLFEELRTETLRYFSAHFLFYFIIILCNKLSHYYDMFRPVYAIITVFVTFLLYFLFSLPFFCVLLLFVVGDFLGF